MDFFLAGGSLTGCVVEQALFIWWTYIVCIFFKFLSRENQANTTVYCTRVNFVLAINGN